MSSDLALNAVAEMKALLVEYFGFCASEDLTWTIEKFGGFKALLSHVPYTVLLDLMEADADDGFTDWLEGYASNPEGWTGDYGVPNARIIQYKE